MWTPTAVVSPPYHWGPIPRRLARSSRSFSSASSCGSGFGEPSSRNSAFLERIADFSKVPPTPTPRMSGGHASGPAVLTHSMIHSFTPATPSAGVSILYFDRFSQPPPLAMTMIRSVAPGPTTTWTSRMGDLRLLLAHRRDELLLALGHLLRRHVFLVRGEAPPVAGRILHLAVAVAPEHVGEGHEDLRARLDRAPEGLVDVGHVH